jgi:hypothetical protein
LHANGTVNELRLSDKRVQRQVISPRKQWKEFLKTIDPEEVEVQFLFL